MSERLGDEQLREWRDGRIDLYSAQCSVTATELLSLRARVAKLEYDNSKLRDALDQLSLVARAAAVSGSKKENSVLRSALTEARRFMDYFANGRTEFVGPGTPLSCLAHIDWALNTERDHVINAPSALKDAPR